MKLTRTALAVLLLAPMAGTALAGVTFSPMATYHIFDKESVRPGDGAEGFALGLGYRFAPAWGVELNYGRTETTLDFPGSPDGRVSRVTLDGHYITNPQASFSPYLLLGGGQENTAGFGGASFESTIANLGAGFLYNFNRNVSLRGELRDVYNFDIESTDAVVSLGLLFTEGFAETSAPAPAPEPEPAPVEELAAPVPVPAPVVVVPVDSDADGVPDNMDKCPSTPAGVQVDPNGCPVDSDKDGVADYLDKCPDTAVNVVVDGTGCPVVLTESISKNININFDSSKAVVKDEYKSEIAEVAKLAQQYPTAFIEIQGHSDSSGNAALNTKLSQARADAVKDVLVREFAVDAARITATGYGSSQPIADNKTVEGRAQNRRVIAVLSAEAKRVQTKGKKK